MSNALATVEDRTARAAGFEPETILPSQLLDKSHLGAALQPEKRLMLAVLEDAVASFQRTALATGRIPTREFAEVRSWFERDDDSWPYSFTNICHMLGFEPSYLRSGLDRWLAGRRQLALAGKVVPMRYAFRRISGSRTRAVVPRRFRSA
jgi:hypothetical protein